VRRTGDLGEKEKDIAFTASFCQKNLCRQRRTNASVADTRRDFVQTRNTGTVSPAAWKEKGELARTGRAGTKSDSSKKREDGSKGEALQSRENVKSVQQKKPEIPDGVCQDVEPDSLRKECQ